MDEIHRIIKTTGFAVISVPNLASLHSRIQLLCGSQPTPIEIISGHIRGFAYKSFKDIIEITFKVIKSSGAGFYPFPILNIQKILSNIFYRSSVSILLFIMKKKSKNMYLDYINGTQTTTIYE